jgi:glycosyltransferase involved in cell wall biosynthesis
MRQPLRFLQVATHPTQYSSPLFRLQSSTPGIETEIAYCALQAGEVEVDPDFGVKVKWDVPVLEGYKWVALANRSPFRSSFPFFGLINPGIWTLIRKGKFDAVVLYIGYVTATFWIAVIAAKLRGIPVLFGTDAYDLSPRDGGSWKSAVKKFLWPKLFRLADVVLAPSSGTAALMKSFGIPDNRVGLAPYCVNNRWWMEQSAAIKRTDVRARWRVPDDATVVLFSAKFQPWKRPQDLLHAFAGAAVPNTYLVYAGDGPLRSTLESEAKSLGIADRVRFLGFVNQSALPATYASSDVLVLPSNYDAFGLVVNEAMLCGCVVIVSDRVGAHFDLVQEGTTGFVFPAGNVEALAALLRQALDDQSRLKVMAEAARERMKSWSPERNVAGIVEAVERAIRFRMTPNQPPRQTNCESLNRESLNRDGLP